MNEMPFPKPSPADPLPLETWLRRTDRSEVGREPFFRGHDAEYGVYRSTVTSLSEGIIGGGTMVFQGGPYLALSGGDRLEEAAGLSGDSGRPGRARPGVGVVLEVVHGDGDARGPGVMIHSVARWNSGCIGDRGRAMRRWKPVAETCPDMPLPVSR